MAQFPEINSLYQEMKELYSDHICLASTDSGNRCKEVNLQFSCNVNFIRINHRQFQFSVAYDQFINFEFIGKYCQCSCAREIVADI